MATMEQQHQLDDVNKQLQMLVKETKKLPEKERKSLISGKTGAIVSSLLLLLGVTTGIGCKGTVHKIGDKLTNWTSDTRTPEQIHADSLKELTDQKVKDSINVVEEDQALKEKQTEDSAAKAKLNQSKKRHKRLKN